MKSTKLALIALLFSILLPASFAHAQSSYAEAYAVGSNGSTIAQPEFTINQQPYIYVEFFSGPPSSSLINELTISTWVPPGAGSPPYPSTQVVSSSNQLWITLSNWNSVKKVGTWDTGTISFGNGPVFAEAASFKVNAAPEPPGTVLFLIGGLIMAISIILRRKKAIAIKVKI